MTGEVKHHDSLRDWGKAGSAAPRSARLIWALRLLGPIVTFTVWLALAGAHMSPEARWVATIATFMAVWWMTEDAAEVG